MMRVLYIGPGPDDPDPGLALRARCNLSVKLKKDTAKIKCPYCGGKGKAKFRPGRVRRMVIRHKSWCPVPVDGSW
ncbi:MAG: hypothetical protein AB1330_03530 [Bacillota bacterium]